MKKTFITLLLISSALLNAKIELLDRIAIIVDDGVVMESQINKAMAALEEGYREQNIQLPPKDVLLDQIKERLIIEELQLQLADRAGVKISDAELNSTFSRLASNNQMSLEEFISFIETNGDSYEEVRETMRKEMRIQRIQSFSELASEYSISSNASNGGLMDWRKAIDMPELFENALKDKSIGLKLDLEYKLYKAFIQ